MRAQSLLWSAAAVLVSIVGLAPTPAQDQSPGSPPSAFDTKNGQPTRIVVKFRPSADGLDPAVVLGSLLTSDSAARWQPARVEALFERRAMGSNGRSGGLAQLARTFVSDIPAGMTATQAAGLLAKDPYVEYAQPDYVRQTQFLFVNDPFYHSSGSWGQPYRDQWGLAKLALENAWEFSRGGGVIVAVVDTGVDYTHPDLATQIWDNPEEHEGSAQDNGFPDDFRGWDFVSNDNDPQDQYGHGTHMAGIIAAATDNGIGIAGVAPDAKIMPVRVMGGAGTGNSSVIASGIAYAADNGANVIALSSGCTSRCPSDPVMENAVRYATAKGAIVIIAAGNRGDNLAFYSPQNMVDPRPIVVAASDQLDHRESFSNFGNFVDIIAPGGGTNVAPPNLQPVSNILSLAASSCAPLFCNDQLRVGNGQYLRRAGTSLAASYVSGVAALILAENPTSSIDEVRERLFGNADDVGPKGHDPMFGWGRLTGLNSTLDMRRYILARILSPSNAESVKGSVRIAGAAAATSFDRYEVFVGEGAAPATWRTTGIFKYGRPTPQGDLARWNTRGLAGFWTIRLVVHDTLGNVREVRRTVTVEKTAAQALIVDVASTGGGEGSVQVDPLGTACDGIARSTQSCEYASAGTTLTLTPLTGANSIFTGWSGACSGTGTCSVLVKGLRSARASFQGLRRLGLRVQRFGEWRGGDFGIEPPQLGGGCVPDSPDAATRCAYLYRHGTSVELTAFQAPFGEDEVCFVSPPCSCSHCTLVMDRDWFVTALVEQTIRGDRDVVLAGRDQRVRLGTPVHLFGSTFVVGCGYGCFPSVTWVDGTTGALLDDTEELTVNLPFGVHNLVFSGYDAEGFIVTSDRMWVIVTDP